MKYAKISGVVRWSQGTTVLAKGDAADDDHALVSERPDLFGDQAPPPKLAGPARAAGPPVVERATRAPGEVRDTPRRGRPRKVAEPVEVADTSADE